MDENLVFLDLDVFHFNEAIEHMGQGLKKRGYVKDSYIHAVINREKDFPTGLEVGERSIGIPHTDPEHVNKAGVAVAKLKNEISIHSMIDPQTKLKTKLLFLLAVEDPSMQVEMLRKLMTAFANSDFLRNLEEAKTKDEMTKLLIEANLV